MITARDIWEAGRKALGLDVPAAPAPATLEQVSKITVSNDPDPVFDPVAYGFEDRDYRIHFRNGCSGEYSGAALKIQFPFDPREVVDVRPVEEVGLA